MIKNSYNFSNDFSFFQHIGGKSAFRVASRMLHTIGLKDLKDKFFERSEFNKKSCPIKMINFCKSGVQAFTCNQTGLSKFLDVHDAAMVVKHSELKSSLSPNTYIYREANRYSGKVFFKCKNRLSIQSKFVSFSFSFQLSTKPFLV